MLKTFGITVLFIASLTAVFFGVTVGSTALGYNIATRSLCNSVGATLKMITHYSDGECYYTPKESPEGPLMPFKSFEINKD